MNRSLIRLSTCLTAGLIACVGLRAGSLRAADSYGLAPLYSLQIANTVSIGRAINVHGDVVGSTRSPDPSALLPTAWLGSSVPLVLTTPIVTDRANSLGINDNGWVAGDYNAPRGTRPIIWTSPTTVIELGSLGGNGGTAIDVNNIGQAVGASGAGSEDHAFIWTEATGMQSMGLLGVGRQASTATAINDAGHATGFVQYLNGGFPEYAFRWTPEEGMISLGPIPGTTNTNVKPTGINEQDLIVGYAQRGSLPGFLAFQWTEANGLQVLPGLPFGDAFTQALGVNNLGEIVGYSGTLNEPRGVLWDSTHGIRDLNSLLDSSALGWTIESAVAINDRGQILAFAYTSRGQLGATVILSPTVPEPGSIVLLAIGLIGCGGIASVRHISRKRAQSARLC